MKPRAVPPLDRIAAWRRDRLLEAGFTARLALQLALDDRMDLHALLDLVDRGCPPGARRSHPRALEGERVSQTVTVSRPASSCETAMPDTLLTTTSQQPDAESLAWVDALSGTGPGHEAAVERLHEILLRAARFEVARRQRAMGLGRSVDTDDLAMQAAADALMAIMGKLETYRGDSRFTTWAYKFALLEAAVKVRKRAWQGREIPLEDDGWARLADLGSAPSATAEMSEMILAIRRGISDELTPHQRTVLIALALNDIPIDVLADRLSTTRGALYKTLHDGRKKLRACLAAEGHLIGTAQPGEAA